MALAAIASREGRPITDVVARLVENHEAAALFDLHTAAMTRVVSPEQRVALDAEQRLLEATLLDGLADDPWPVDEHGEPAR